jgi:predicted RNA-binding protein with PIN domain
MPAELTTTAGRLQLKTPRTRHQHLEATEALFGIRARIVRFVQWIIDAMNVIGTRPDGWWKDRRRAMVGLVDRLERWASAEGHDVTVVFEQPTSPPIRSSLIEIGHAPRAATNSADDQIVRLVRAHDRPQEINVVTSDMTLAGRVRSAGASVYSAASFRNLIDS